MWFILFLIVIGITFMVVDALNKNKSNQSSLNNLLQGERVTKIHRNNVTNTSLFYNEDNNEIGVITDNRKNKIKHKDILQVELTEDESSLTRTKRGSQAAGVAIGSLLGVAGAVIGGLSAKQEHISKVRKIGLRLVVNDTSNPVREVTLHNFGVLRDKDSEEYQTAYKESYEWFKLIEVLIHQADKEDESQVSTVN